MPGYWFKNKQYNKLVKKRGRRKSIDFLLPLFFTIA